MSEVRKTEPPKTEHPKTESLIDSPHPQNAPTIQLLGHIIPNHEAKYKMESNRNDNWTRI